ncbi:MAG: hypothetical protein AAGB48_12345 [Planctomycetota bacterium]
MNRILSTASAALVASAALLTGCTQDGPYRADDSELNVTGRLDVQDVEEFAKELAEALIASGALQKEDGPARVVIDTYKNSTDQPGIDRDRVLFPLLATLNNSGIARGYLGTTVAGEGLVTVDAAQEERAFDGESLERRYDYALAVKLFQQRGDTRRITQTSYIIQFQVVDVEEGFPVWQDQRTITKQDRRRRVGL